MTASPQGKALITGASTGIGALYAHKLAARGYDPILVARNQEKLNEVEEQIRAETGRVAETMVADLSKATDLKAVEERLLTDGAINAIVNNAGTASAKKLLDCDLDYLEEMILINVTALTRLSHAAASSFVSRGKGLIINIGSVMGLAPESFNGVYSGTKAYVQNLSISLNQELEGKGVRVQLVMPGATATPIWEKVGVAVGHMPAGVVMNAEDMVSAALSGLDQGEFVTIPSLPDMADFQAYEAARLALRPNLSRSVPAPRYSKGPIDVTK